MYDAAQAVETPLSILWKQEEYTSAQKSQQSQYALF